VPAGTVPAVVVGLAMEKRTTFEPMEWKPIISPVDPVAEPRESSEPITISPSTVPVRATVPLVVPATLCAETVDKVNAAVP